MSGIIINNTGLLNKMAAKDDDEFYSEHPDIKPLRMSFPVPTCSICHKPVDSFECHRLSGDRVALVAECHGAQSEVIVKLEERCLVNTKMAFTHPKFHQGIKEKSWMDRIPKLYKTHRFY